MPEEKQPPAKPLRQCPRSYPTAEELEAKGISPNHLVIGHVLGGRSEPRPSRETEGSESSDTKSDPKSKIASPKHSGSPSRAHSKRATGSCFDVRAVREVL
jgi:hypothetical protein